MYWDGWPFSRVVLLFIATAYTLIFIQVTLMHYRQNFQHWSQWIPVLALPIIALNALLLGFYHANWARTLFGILTIVGIIAGVFGFFMHFRGIGKRVDGYRLQNFLVGPPIALPSLITIVSTLGLLTLYWS